LPSRIDMTEFRTACARVAAHSHASLLRRQLTEDFFHISNTLAVK
jgi:hypothetical protein